MLRGAAACPRTGLRLSPACGCWRLDVRRHRRADAAGGRAARRCRHRMWCAAGPSAHAEEPGGCGCRSAAGADPAACAVPVSAGSRIARIDRFEFAVAANCLRPAGPVLASALAGPLGTAFRGIAPGPLGTAVLPSGFAPLLATDCLPECFPVPWQDRRRAEPGPPAQTAPPNAPRADDARAAELAGLRGRGDRRGAVIDRGEVLPRRAGGMFVLGLHRRGSNVLLTHGSFLPRRRPRRQSAGAAVEGDPRCC